MLFLNEGEVCPLSIQCKYAQDCWGSKANRENTFSCSFVDDLGNIKEDGFRNPHDKTGKMQILID